MTTSTDNTALDAAYEECQAVTKREARNFYYAFLTLPHPRRRAIYAAYAFSRLADDIADGDGAPPQKRSELAALRERLRNAYAGRPEGAILTALADAAATYDIPESLFQDIITGVEMDLEPRRFEDFDELRHYCYHVASVVGLVSIRIFGYRDAPLAQETAVDFGLAMQLTNILRDLREDIERDRVYLPLDEMARFGYTEDDSARRRRPRAVPGDDALPGQPGPTLLRLGHSAAAAPGAGVARLCGRAAPPLQSPAEQDGLARLGRLLAAREPLVLGETQPDMQTLDYGPAPQRPEALTSVAVLGGGLAGMAAAWRLVNAGYRVTLVERRPYLGGRAYSFVDRETGQEVDNGQHVFLGCCNAYRRFLDEIGSLELTSRQKRLRVEVRAPSGKRGVLSALPLPAPFHLLPSLLRYPHISVFERLRAIPALLLIRLEGNRDHPALRRESFHDWLRRHGQSERAIAAFWNLLIVPALNDSAEDVSASAGFMLFQEALLRDRNGGNIGFARAGLSAVMGDAVRERLTGAGADVLLDRTADALVVEGEHVTGVRLTDGETLSVDACVSALPPDALLRLLPEELREHAAFAPAATHTWSPIVNLHVWYDRQIADFDFLAFVDSPVQWVFNRTAIAGLGGPGQYITVSLSGAWEFWPMTKDALRETFIPELARLFPAANDAEITRFVIVKEQRATFRSLPGAPDNRLPSVTPLPNLFLSGDWTDTGWPATMEGAVRSGNIAAEAVEKKC